MELRNENIILIGLIVAGVLFLVGLIPFKFFKRKGKTRYKDGKKVAALSYIKKEPYFRFKIVFYKVVLNVVRLCCLAAVLLACYLMARPHVVNINEKNMYARDIIICMDVSGSVMELDMQLVDSLHDMVDQLHGERMGIVLFDSSPVVICPLTDDYEYISEMLDTIKKSIRCMSGYSFTWDDDDYSYMYSYIWAGTETGMYERGSSLIPDGMAAAAFAFPSEEEDEEDRTKIMIFATDNELCGDPLVTLDQAADICVEEGVVVYGLGTEWMYREEQKEMERAVEKTGGKFYLQEDADSIDEIVEEIQQTTANLVRGERQITKEDMPEAGILALIVSICAAYVLSKTIRL